jgi:hypothetical protein
LRRLLVIFLSVLGALPLLAASAALPETTAVLKGAEYIKSVQTASGTYGTTDAGQNMDAIIAVRSAGFDPAKDLVGGKGPLDFLMTSAPLATSPAIAAKTALAARAAGLDPTNVGGANLIEKVNAGYDPAKGTYGPDDFSQSVAILGLACTGNTVPPLAATALKSTQIATDGGWGFGGFSDPDTTAIAVQALLAAGVPNTDGALVKALGYLKANQAADGGFGYDPASSNASSTAYVVQALIALGENPESAAYMKSGATPVSFLLSQQTADGAFLGFDPAFATNQVVPALAGRTFCNAVETPITRVRPVATPTPTLSPATATPTPPPATAPKPPATGDTLPNDAGESPLLFAISALLIAAAGGIALGLRRGDSPGS